MMTKKNYEAVADIIKENLDLNEQVNEKCAVEFLAKDLSRYFASDNPNFNRQTFMTACGF